MMNNIFVTAFFNALMVPVCIFILGFVIELLSHLILQILALFVGSQAAWVIANRVLFIGTIHHELSHALFAFLTGAKVVRVIPIRFKGTELGRVDIVPRGNIVFRSFQQCMSAIAPVVCGVASLAGLYYGVLPLCVELWQQIIVYVIAFSIVLHMNMSAQDVSVAWKGMPVCILILYAIFLMFHPELLCESLIGMI